MRISPPRALLISGLGIILGVSCLTGAGASVRPFPPGPGAWREVWADSFNGARGNQPLQSAWKFDTGQGIFGTGEIETMTNSPANVEVDGAGNLVITALNRGGSWTSGRIQTYRTFGAAAGGEMEITASIRQPALASGIGYWPAFWLLGPGSWPANGEIDILEDVNGLSQHSGTLHCGNLTQQNPDGTTGPCHEYVGLTSQLQPCPGCQAGYHDYSIIVDRRNPADEQIRWYLDGQEFFAVNENQVGAAAWRQAIDHGFSVIFDLAIGGRYPDSTCGCTTPDSQTPGSATMSVASLAVYDLP